MNRFSPIRRVALALLLALFSLPAFAQLDAIEDFLAAGEANITELTRAYLAPLPTGLSTALNSGWTTKAAPTKTLGFSLQFRVAASAVPSGDQTFDARELNLTGITVSGVESNTLLGDSDAGQTLTVDGTGASFSIPEGTGVPIVPLPIIQGNVGLIKKTDLTLRYTPETDLGDYGDVSVFGAAIKHDVNQYLPAGKLLPVDISVMAAFTQVNMNANLSGDGQRVETTTNAFVFNALVGKTLPFLSAYGGLGFQTGNFQVDMVGQYDLGAGQSITDPVSYDDNSDAVVHALAGAQFKLGFFRIFLEGTASNYFTINGGIGLGFRN
ncbi:MAG: DUF6588 family protein [Bacteroidota bacterium]